VIPIEVSYSNPITTALIGDLEVRLVVDSGGLLLGLRPEVIAILKLEHLGEETSRTNIFGETTESDLFTVPLVTIGGTEYSNFAAYEWSAPPPLAKRTPPVDGIIGRDFLNDFVVIYNYGESTITLYDNSEQIANECEGVEIPLLEHPERVIVSEIEVDNGTVAAIWDTGATHSFVKAHIAAEREFLLVADDDGTEFYYSQKFAVGGSDFGPLDFASLPFVEPNNVDVFVGRNFFAEHVVCVNVFENLLKVRANP